MRTRLASCARASGHDFDALSRWVALTFELQYLAQRTNRHLELLERRLPRRQPLQPEPGREDRHHDAVLVLAGEADELVREAGDERQQRDALDDQPVPGRPPEERENEDRDDHHPEQE